MATKILSTDRIQNLWTNLKSAYGMVNGTTRTPVDPTRLLNGILPGFKNFQGQTQNSRPFNQAIRNIREQLSLIETINKHKDLQKKSDKDFFEHFIRLANNGDQGIQKVWEEIAGDLLENQDLRERARRVLNDEEYAKFQSEAATLESKINYAGIGWLNIGASLVKFIKLMFKIAMIENGSPEQLARMVDVNMTTDKSPNPDREAFMAQQLKPSSTPTLPA